LTRVVITRLSHGVRLGKKKRGGATSEDDSEGREGFKENFQENVLVERKRDSVYARETKKGRSDKIEKTREERGNKRRTEKEKESGRIWEAVRFVEDN